MFLDAEARLITFRILYAGPPGASKLTALRTMQRALPGRRRGKLFVYHVEGAQVASLPWCPAADEELLGCRVGYEIVTIPGKGAPLGTEELLLRAADAVVFLPERGDPAGEPSRRALEELVGRLAALGRDPESFPLVVQGYADGPPGVRLWDGLEEVWPDKASVDVAGDERSGIMRVFEDVRSRLERTCQEMERREGRERTLRRLRGRTLPMPGGGEWMRTSTWSVILYWVLLAAAAAGAFLVSITV